MFAGDQTVTFLGAVTALELTLANISHRHSKSIARARAFLALGDGISPTTANSSRSAKTGLDGRTLRFGDPPNLNSAVRPIATPLIHSGF